MGLVRPKDGTRSYSASAELFQQFVGIDRAKQRLVRQAHLNSFDS